MLEDAEAIVVQTLGVKQGDVLGPQLYLFHGLGLMMAWRAEGAVREGQMHLPDQVRRCALRQGMEPQFLLPCLSLY